jgi:hypothetical protein
VRVRHHCHCERTTRYHDDARYRAAVIGVYTWFESRAGYLGRSLLSS